VNTRADEVAAIKIAVEVILTVWKLKLPQEVRDTLPSGSLEALRDDFVQFCDIGLQGKTTNTMEEIAQLMAHLRVTAG